jgi:hypothetical protein
MECRIKRGRSAAPQDYTIPVKRLEGRGQGKDHGKDQNDRKDGKDDLHDPSLAGDAFFFG